MPVTLSDCSRRDVTSAQGCVLGVDPQRRCAIQQLLYSAPGLPKYESPRSYLCETSSYAVTDQAFVTLVTNDIYCQGALVLGKSLRNHNTSRQLVIMITSQVTSRMRGILAHVFDVVVEVSTLDSADSVRLSLLKRPELGITFTKLQCWTLTQYTKCVYLDADTIVLCNIDELFDRVELSAAPDSGWPDCFNSGVFVFKPSVETFSRLLQFAESHGSFDGGDQGLLNSFFNTWAVSDISKHLPFIYNLSISSVYTYKPAFKQFGSEAKVVHFIGTPKPWNLKYNPQAKCVVEDESLSGHQHLSFLTLWWELYISDVLPLLTETEDLEGSSSEQHHVGQIELLMKNDHPPPVYSPEAPADYADWTLPDCKAEHHAFDDTVEGQDLQVPTETCLEQPVTQDDTPMVHLAQSASELSIQEAEEKLRTEEERRKWEQGQIDYMGKYSFDNIQKKLDRFLQ